MQQRAFAGMSRATFVDETATTLKLRPVARGHLERSRWPMIAAMTLTGLGAVALFVIDVPARVVATPHTIAASPIVAPAHRVDAEPILASAAMPIVDTSEDIVIVDDEDDEIVIFDEPVAPEPMTRAARRARARTTARNHTKAGEAARIVGNLAEAERELGAALTALPSHGPAAAALAELHMTRGSHRAALGYAKRAFRAAPRKLDYMVLLGDAYARTNNRAAAEKLWRKAAGYGSAAARSRLTH